MPLGVHAFYVDGVRLVLAGPNRNLYLAIRQLRRAAEHPQVSGLGKTAEIMIRESQLKEFI
jgi:hypothetical protein